MPNHYSEIAISFAAEEAVGEAVGEAVASDLGGIFSPPVAGAPPHLPHIV